MSFAIPSLEAVSSAGGVCMQLETSSCCLPLKYKEILKNLPPEKQPLTDWYKLPLPQTPLDEMLQAVRREGKGREGQL